MSARALISGVRWRQPSVLPGFGITFGYSLLYLSLIVLIPLAALVARPAELGWAGFWAVITAPRVLAALKLSFATAFVGALVNAVFGLITAWALVRYEFPM
jgi:sulfate transport system permease protein